MIKRLIKKIKFKKALLGLFAALAIFASTIVDNPPRQWQKLPSNVKSRIETIANNNLAKLEGNKFLVYLDDYRFDEAKEIIKGAEADLKLIRRFTSDSKPAQDIEAMIKQAKILLTLHESRAIVEEAMERLNRGTQQDSKTMRENIEKLK